MDARKRSQFGAMQPARRTRAASTVDRILASAIRTILERGAGKMSMQDVGDAAGVSRGTLYRYFPTKERLLEAVTDHLREQYDDRVASVTSAHVEPEPRLRALLDFLGAYLDGGQAHRFLEIEPHFALGYYRRTFPHFVKRTETVLAPVFDEWERRAGVKLDRQLLAELLVRYTLSDLLVPAGLGRQGLADRLMKLLGDVGAH